MKGAVIEARDLSKWYGQVVGLLKADFVLPPGVHGLLGPNGAGKSTLMGLITGTLEPSSGDVTVCGKRPFGNHLLMARVGFCPEQDAFYESMTAATFLATLLQMNGYRRDEAALQATEALAVTGMESAAGKKMGAMSKGMRQRVKLAQALAHHPDVLILDEPLNGMDPVGRRSTIELVKELGDAGHTVIVSSHILHEIEAMTNSILLIHQGRVRAFGDIHEIRELLDDHPHHVAVRCKAPRRLAAAIVARGEVVSVEVDEGLRLVTAKTRHPAPFYRDLPELAQEVGTTIEEITSPDDNLAAVFDYLVSAP